MTWARQALAVVVVALCAADPAWAQSRNGQRRNERLEVSVGAAWFGSSTFAEVEATQITPGGPPRPVLRTSTALDASLGIAARVSAALTTRLAAEAAVAVSPTHLTTSVSDDVESFPDLAASEPITQYLFEGGVRWRVGGLRATGLAPFLSVGGGYLRQLHDQQTLASTGRSFYVGGGAHYPLRRGNGWIKSAGLRFDIRMSVLAEGVATDEATHAVPAAAAGLFIRF